MSWLADEGLEEFLAQYDLEYGSAHEYRQRHVLRLLVELIKRR